MSSNIKKQVLFLALTSLVMIEIGLIYLATSIA